MGAPARVYRFVVAIVFVAFVGSSAISYEKNAVPDKATTPIKFDLFRAPTVEFSLPDMMCEDGCAFAVKDILEKQPGVRDAHVDFEAKTATVAIDEGTFSAERTLAELVDKGFDNSRLSSDSSTSHEVASFEAMPAKDE